MNSTPESKGAPAPHTGAHFLWLRILLALSVVFAHFAAISGNEQHGPKLLSSTIAVQAFFVISGWIVPASAERSATLLGFWIRRFARLYPLYAAVICVQGLLGVVMGDAPEQPIRELVRYVTANLLFLNFLQPSLFGLFATAPVPAINPSLWTLKIEVMFYLVAPLLVLYQRVQRGRALWVMSLGAIVLFYLAQLRSENLARQLPGQLRFFMAGFVCWRLSTLGIARGARWLPLVAALGLVLAHRYEHNLWLPFAQPLFVASFVYGLAHSLPEPRWMPDISYGLYIWHAPLIQCGFALGLLHTSLPSLATAIILTASLAACSWYGLEQPAIRAARAWSNRADRRKTTSPAGQPYATEAQP